MPKNTPVLLSIVEVGGYQNFNSLYKDVGFEVVSADSMRKAVKLIKKHEPSVIVTEFNFQSDFRDRTSTVETLLSTLQGRLDAKVIVFYEKEFVHQYNKLLQQYSVFSSMPFPVDTIQLQETLEQAKL